MYPEHFHEEKILQKGLQSQPIIGQEMPSF